MAEISASAFKRIVLWSVLSVTLLFSFLFLIVILLFLFNVRTEEEVELEKYQYLSVNKKTKEAFFGIVTQWDPIEDDFYTFEAEDDVILISNFGDAEYKCTGTCYCEKGGRRAAGSSIPRLYSAPILILLTAATSLLAYKKGEELYHEKCEEVLFDDCGTTEDIIRSEIDRCNEISKERYEDFEAPTHKLYLCEGNCMIRHVFLPLSKNPAIPAALEFKCENYEYSGEVFVIDGKDESPFGKEQVDVAIHKFILTSMDPFCRQLKVYEHENTVSESLCIGGRTMFVNPTVKCREVVEEIDEI